MRLAIVEVENYLPDMHYGEIRRDAAPGVRGFLFQDLVAIDELTKDETEFICTEFIEDVCTATSKGIRIIQSKYTPKTDLDIKGITRELYYQYVKLRKYGYCGDIIPVLRYHADVVVKPNEETATKYLNLQPRQKPFEGTVAENKVKAMECIKKGTKKEREDSLFISFHDTNQLKNFLEAYQMEEVKENIGVYRKALGEKLDMLLGTFSCLVSDVDNRQGLLIALAIKLVQERYNEPLQHIDNHDLLKHRKVQREDFLGELNRVLASEPQFSVIVSNFVDEAYCEILDEQLLSNDFKRLDSLYLSTNEWVMSNMNSHSCVIKLLNTVNTDLYTPCVSDEQQVLRQSLYICKERIITFLKNIWKIKFNLSQDRFEECMLTEINNYIAFSFQYQDDWSIRSIVMGSIGDCPRKKINYVLKRIRAWDERPQKWYLRSYNNLRGFGDYSIDVAHIAPEKLDITSLSPDRFAVECMECVGIDEGEWENKEKCKNNIFSKKCVYGGKA
jgi:hypothetical protein